MASSSFHYFLSTTLLVLLSTTFTAAQSSIRPSALVVPVTKDASTLQYITRINQRTPSVPINLVVDLGGEFLWVDCDQGYVSSSYSPARCGSAQCSLAKSSSCSTCFSAPRPGCNNNTCGLFPENGVTQTASSGDVISDIVSVNSTNGSNPVRVVSVPRFLLSCAPTFLLDGLARNVQGVAGLGRTNIALPSQFAAAFSFHRKFAICLTRSTSSSGVIFFGDGPYMMIQRPDISPSLMFTPLIRNPVSNTVGTGREPSAEYFIGVKSIKINDKRVPLNTTLLTITRQQGAGGTKISTIHPYTVMQTSIYNAFIDVFVKEAAARNITRVAAVAPFGACFSSEGVGSTRVGYAVPTIDLVLQNKSVFWRIFGSNSVVQVRHDVFCLAFVDGGSEARTSIVIGGYQLEDNLVQFDLATSRLGFSSTLLFRQTTCGNFNFTQSK